MVPQQHVHRLSVGQPVGVTLANGEQVQGAIRFISSLGEESTRTFRVEVEIANDGHLRAGASATAYIPEEEVDAHFVSGGLLTLDTDGQMGIKTVDNTGLVSFHPVVVEYSEADGMWVSGLPLTAKVIVSGQGFAEVGGRVQVSDAPAGNIEARNTAVSGGMVDADIN
jgi:multidrug efflux system membrane fusion protein